MSIQKTAVALSNADGGEFVVGVADEADEPHRSHVVEAELTMSRALNRFR
jgi:predicted HTH transcriptional regulator